MAQVPATCTTCGATTHVTAATTAAAYERRDYLLAHGGVTCTDCYYAAKKAEAADAATKFAEDNALPALTGSDKQIAWANTIRLKKIAQIDAVCVVSSDAPAELADHIAKAVAAVKAQADARYWIDNRDADVRALVRAAAGA